MDTNIKAKLEGNILTLTIDLSKSVGRTKEDSGDVIARTGGYISLTGEKGSPNLNLHMWKKDVKASQRRTMI